MRAFRSPAYLRGPARCLPGPGGCTACYMATGDAAPGDGHPGGWPRRIQVDNSTQTCSSRRMARHLRSRWKMRAQTLLILGGDASLFGATSAGRYAARRGLCRGQPRILQPADRATARSPCLARITAFRRATADRREGRAVAMAALFARSRRARSTRNGACWRGRVHAVQLSPTIRPLRTTGAGCGACYPDHDDDGRLLHAAST